jgi:hypothetical protein
MSTLLNKWGEYYCAVTAATLVGGAHESDRLLVNMLVDSIIVNYQDEMYQRAYEGMSLLSRTFFPDGPPTFAPEQLHPHFVDLLPDLKSWVGSVSETPQENFWATRVGKAVSGNQQKNSATREGMTLLLRDLEERRKLNEIFA